MDHLRGLFKVLISVFLIFTFGCGEQGTLEKNAPIENKNTKDSQAPLQEPTVVVAEVGSEGFTMIERAWGPGQIVSKNFGDDGSSTGSETPCLSPNAVDHHGGLVYLVCSLSQEIQVYDSAHMNLQFIINLGNGVNPWDIKILNDEKAYVSSYLKDEVLVINPSKDYVGPEVLKRLSLKNIGIKTSDGREGRARPQGMALAGKYLFVSITNLNEKYEAAGSGYVAVFDTEEDDRLVKLMKSGGTNTVGVVVHPHFPESPWVYLLNAGTYKGGLGYVGDGTVGKVNGLTLRKEGVVEVGGAPFGMTIVEDGRAFLSNGMNAELLSFDTGSDELLPSTDLESELCMDLPSYYGRFLSSVINDGRYLYVTEFNTSCFLSLNLEDLSLHYRYKTGRYPQFSFFKEEL